MLKVWQASGPIPGISQRLEWVYLTVHSFSVVVDDALSRHVGDPYFAKEQAKDLCNHEC